MNKNDILMIARSLYLQQSISRQLFAKFDTNKQLDFLDGSFAGRASLVDNFNVFIGSDDNVSKGKILQFIKKDGEKFTIYGLTKDSQVDFNYSHNITGWNRLALYISNVSAQIVATNTSLHRKLKDFWGVLNSDIYNRYENKAYFEQAYGELAKKNQGQQLQQKFIKKKIEYIFNSWVQQLILMLDSIKNQFSKMHLFYLSNSTDSIPVYITQLRQLINDKSDEYKYNKNIQTKDVKKAVQLLQTWFLNIPIVKQIQNFARRDLQKQNNINNVTSKMTNVCQRVYETFQYVTMLQKHTDKPLALKLLNAINESNTSYQLNDRLIELQIYNKGSKFVETLKQNHNLNIEDGVQLLKKFIDKKGEQKDYTIKIKKDKLSKLIDFLYGDDKSILLSTWNQIYKILVSILQSEPQYVQLVDELNVFFHNFKDQEFTQLITFLICSYKIANKEITRANTELNINQKNSQYVLQQTVDKIRNKFGQEGDTVVKNLLQFVQLLNIPKNTSVKQVVNNFGQSIMYSWVKGAKIINRMRNFIYAIEQ